MTKKDPYKTSFGPTFVIDYLIIKETTIKGPINPVILVLFSTKVAKLALINVKNFPIKMTVNYTPRGQKEMRPKRTLFNQDISTNHLILHHHHILKTY
jgi:hypothetical protein